MLHSTIYFLSGCFLLGWLAIPFDHPNSEGYRDGSRDGSRDGMRAGSLETDSVQWQTGKALNEQLQKKVTLTFVGAPLRDELYRFARQQRVGLFIDRRVDPGIPLELTIQNQTVPQILWQIADQHGLGVCQLGNFFYLGPLATSDSLPVVWQQMKKESNRLKQRSSVKWNDRSTLNWPFLSSPDKLIQELVRNYQFNIDSTGSSAIHLNDRMLPHDLWPEILLPDLPLDEQVALLVIGFGLWFERDAKGQTVKLIPFPEQENGQVEFDQIEHPRTRLNDLKRTFSDVRFSVSGRTLRAAGPVQQLREVRRHLLSIDSPTETPAAGARQVFSLNIKASRGNILASISQQTGRQFEYDPASSQALIEEIQLTVDQVELEEMIQAVLEESGLTYELDSQFLRIK